MFRRTDPQATRYALLLASVSLVALGSSAGISVAKDDNVRSDFRRDSRCSDAGDRDRNRDRFDHRSFMLEHDSLVISSSTYDPSQGAVASLSIGTTLAGSATKTSKAVANNDYVHVWNNASVDASFGVTSAIAITDADPVTG